MKPFTVREYELYDVAAEPKDNAISWAELEFLYQVSERISVRFFEQKGRDKIQFFQHVGIVSTGERILEILPKIESTESDVEDTRKIRLNLMKMLFVANDLHVTEAELAQVCETEANWIDILIFLFCRHLADQIRRGFSKIYRVDKANLNAISGQILFDEQLRDNLVHRERIACEFDEFDENHPLNQVLKLAITKMQGAAYSWRTRVALNELRMVFDGIDDRPYQPKWVEAIQLDRLTQRFSFCLSLARLFLRGMSPSVSTGKHDSFALLFDMNMLFERYIGTKLSDVVINLGHTIELQHSGFALMVDKSFQLKPDIVTFQHDKRPVCIADTKWKLLDIYENKLGISQADLYQMLAYATRYNCDDLILIYPFHRNDRNSDPFCKRLLYDNINQSRITVAQVCLRDLDSVHNRLREIYQSVLEYMESFAREHVDFHLNPCPYTHKGTDYPLKSTH